MLPLAQDLSFGARAPEVNDTIRRGQDILKELDPHIRQRMREDGLEGFADGLKQIHLHLHTPDGSLLDGFARIDKVMETTKKYGMPAVGVSEHGTMASHFKFYNAAKDAGVKPILGMEAYITPNRHWRQEYKQVSYEMESFEVQRKDPETGEKVTVIENRPKLYQVHRDDLDKLGLTVITALNDKPTMDSLIPRIDELIIKELQQEAELAGEKKTKTQLKKGVSARKARHTRDGVRFAVRQKRNIRDLFEWRPKMNHLLLIAKNQEGYKNMLTMSSKGFFEGFYYKPRIDYELVKQYGKGIIATSACLGSDISQCIIKGYDRLAKNLIKFYASCFDEFYLEVQPSEQPEQHLVNRKLMQFSEELGLPLICTTDVHMVDHSEKEIHAAFTTIGKSEDTSDISVYDSCYFMSTEEILGKGIPWQAVYNTMVVANKCNVSLDDKTIKYPEYEVPEGYDFDTYLRRLAGDGLFQKLIEDNIDDPTPYIERLDYELEVIKNKNISAYFIIVWDYINFAKDKGILVGPGRGSAAGSLCSYVLGITNLDPIKYDLLFERCVTPPVCASMRCQHGELREPPKAGATTAWLETASATVQKSA